MLLKSLIWTLLFPLVTFCSFSQDTNFQAVLLSIESDYEYRYRPRARNQLLIDYQINAVYYRKKSNRKFKPTSIPSPLFFKDSVDYEELKTLILKNAENHVAPCAFRNKGSLKITLIYGSSHENVSVSYEFGSVISCADENNFATIRRIESAYVDLRKLIFE